MNRYASLYFILLFFSSIPLFAQPYHENVFWILDYNKAYHPYTRGYSWGGSLGNPIKTAIEARIKYSNDEI